MKRILLLLLITIIGTLLVGCQLFQGTTTTTTTTTTTITTTTEDTRYVAVRQFLYEQTLKFGEVEDKDLVWSDDGNTAIGSSNVILWNRDDSINIILIEENKWAMVEIILDYGSNSMSTEVWNIMYTYIDNEREIYIYLDYYFYGRLLIENYSSITVPKRQRDWVNELTLLQMKDIEFVLTLLGYDVDVEVE